MRAEKPTEVCRPNSPYPWEWAEFYETDSGRWLPVAALEVEGIKLPSRFRTAWQKCYTADTVRILKEQTPFLS